MGLLTASTVKNFEFHESKMADGRHVKTVNSPYLCSRLTDFDEIWRDDAYWVPTAERPLNVEFLKIQDGGSRHLENHKNCDISATA